MNMKWKRHKKINQKEKKKQKYKEELQNEH